MQMISAFWALKVCFKIVLDGKKSDPNLYIKHKILCLLVGTNSSSRVDCVSLTPPSQAHSREMLSTLADKLHIHSRPFCILNLFLAI